MPTYYFHVSDESGTIVKDEEGAELADAMAARGRAEQIGRQFLDEEISADGRLLDNPAKLAIEVKNSAGQIVYTVHLSELTKEPS